MKITRTITENVNYFVRKNDRTKYTEFTLFSRKDIFLIQYPNTCNIFVSCDGTYQVDIFDKNITVDYTEIKRVVEKVMEENSDYVRIQTAHIALHSI